MASSQRGKYYVSLEKYTTFRYFEYVGEYQTLLQTSEIEEDGGALCLSYFPCVAGTVSRCCVDVL